MNKILQLSNVGYTYDNKEWILRHLNSGINEGEFVAMVGENGAGKSTLLNLILGNLKAQEGEIRLFGDLVQEKNHYEDIAYISQNSVMNYRHFPTTVSEVVKVHLRYLKKGKDDSSYLKLVNLEEQGNKTLSELSGGQLQRVAILLALIKNAKFILLDEPTTGVDQVFSEELYQMLEQLRKEGRTILMVTHHLQDVQSHVDRVLKIVNGQCEEVQYA
ncbi:MULTISPECIES: metal ABC transporter ATP-binding protein [Terrabacteria group]|uniref:metal ABC transporter ATP-binding protein n=1 Tax=Bacillati TaxID=1783272 RepID=UPI00193A4C5E|nr:MULTISPECIES: metal ABC transporter ATP-binding protein [Terrabacteria group]MBW9212160.1 metal ABC transporter ATP-binding protein [Trueperella sp. zg.1013]QRG86295.1 metal ABC transporter ATP-binding protein [Bulleidia sp. zg-1006]